MCVRTLCPVIDWYHIQGVFSVSVISFGSNMTLTWIKGLLKKDEC